MMENGVFLLYGYCNDYMPGVYHRNVCVRDGGRDNGI